MPLRLNQVVMALIKAQGESLNSPAIDSVNTFDKPDVSASKNIAVKRVDKFVHVNLAPHAVTVIALSEK